MNDDPSPRFTAALDQLSGTLASYAGLYGVYFRSLVSDGLPYDLVLKMTRDYAWLTSSRMIFPEFPPPLPPE